LPDPETDIGGGDDRGPDPSPGDVPPKRRFGRRDLAVVAALVVLGLALAFGLQRLRPAEPSPPQAEPSDRAQVVQAALSDPDSPRLGASHPDVTVVVFTDYRCPVCRATDPALERLLARDPNVQVVFKNLAVFGPPSLAAAKVALAANAQGRYAQVHHALMSTTISGDPEQLKSVAVATGVDWPRASAEIASHNQAYEAQVRRNGAQAWALGMRGTPSYIIGYHLIQGGLDDEKLTQLVAEARQTGP
jgi:protein-disulfide isomerase